MQIAFFKHALSAGLLAVLLGALAPLAAPAASASAQTTSDASSAPQTTATPSAGTVPAGTTAAEATPTGGSATSGIASGGAAPTPASPSLGKLTRATWYGPGFYGRMTACGQKLTRKIVGVASRTLPCGTLVRISYRGHMLTAPVLDRGPYGANGAMWDLTAGAAHALEIKETVRIGTQIVGSVPNTPMLGEPLSTTLSPTTLSSAADASSATTGGATPG